MLFTARRWPVTATGMVAGLAAVLGVVGSPAAADPLYPAPPSPAPTVAAPEAVPAAPLTAAAPNAALSPTAPNTLLSPAAPNAVVSPTAPAAAVAPTPALVPAQTGTLRSYLQDKGVKLEAQDPRTFRGLLITLPMPTGWTQVPDPNVPDAYAVIADRAGGDGLYTSNAQVVIYKLVGDFDSQEAITHGYVDSQELSGWKSTNASLQPFNGFPSSVIEGTYRDGSLTLNTSRRNVIATSGADRYLVTLSVTTAVNQVVATANSTDAINQGFRITDPAAVPPAPAVPAAPAPADPLAPSVPAAPVVPAAPAVPATT